MGDQGRNLMAYVLIGFRAAIGKRDYQIIGPLATITLHRI
jgi:hypothetical protein